MEDTNKCGFCHTGEDNESICGTLHKDKVEGKVVCAHHKCMQYSALLVQYKTNSFGGFKKQEVAKEIKRGGRLICALCKADKTKKCKKGATSGCSLASCRKTFHYLCVSMNPKTIAKRYRVAAGDQVVILYRVFCCQDHETRYKDDLSADDIVGKHESSDDDDDDEVRQDDDETDVDDKSDTDTEPPPKKSKTANSRLKKKSKKEESESGMSSPGMTMEEVVKETHRQYTTLVQNTPRSGYSKDEDSCVTATSGHESCTDITDDFNTSNSPSESDLSEDGRHVIKNVDEGFHIIIPSKLDEVELKTICKQAGYSEESCLLWPKVYNKKGLQDKHMPYVMWNLATKLRHQDIGGLVRCLSAINFEMYDSLYTLEKHENIEVKLKLLSEKICSSYKGNVCRVMYMDSLCILLLSLPAAMLETWDVWSVVNVYQWAKDTIMPSCTTKQLKPSSEKKIMLNWLLPRLHKKSVELNVFPQEETLCLDHGHKFMSVAKEIEFELETISQSLLAKSLVKVLVVRKVNRDVVNFKLYIHKLMALFFEKNVEHECYCVVHVLPSDGIHMLEDFMPAGTCRGARVFSAFSPSVTPVSCLVAYTAGSHHAGGAGEAVGSVAMNSVAVDGPEEQFSLYMDVDDVNHT